MNELELIRLLTSSLPGNDAVVTGTGDDCAVLDLGLPDKWLLFKTDAIVEGIHFTSEASPKQIGHKALARCLSDIAAMAGTPTAALVTLALPKEFDPEILAEIYTGMTDLAKRHQVAIVGGETTTNPERMLLSISLLGTVSKDKCVRRDGTKVGDAVFVTGQLGGSIAGHHLDFEPRLTEARWLAGHFDIHSMIDISDGLASDVRHLLECGKLGTELHKPSIPISREAKLQAKAGSSAKPPLLAALTDGEDFELLFTVASKNAVPLLDAWKKQFPEVKLSCIGKITSTPGVKLRDKDGFKPMPDHGYVHFT